MHVSLLSVTWLISLLERRNMRFFRRPWGSTSLSLKKFGRQVLEKAPERRGRLGGPFNKLGIPPCQRREAAEQLWKWSCCCILWDWIVRKEISVGSWRRQTNYLFSWSFLVLHVMENTLAFIRTSFWETCSISCSSCQGSGGWVTVFSWPNFARPPPIANQIRPDKVAFLAELQRYQNGVLLREMTANSINTLDEVTDKLEESNYQHGPRYQQLLQARAALHAFIISSQKTSSDASDTTCVRCYSFRPIGGKSHRFHVPYA